MKKEYQWRLGFHAPKGVTASTAKNEMERVRRESGNLTADALVEASAPPDAPLHPAFEWNNATAGRAWRRQQAMQIIRSVQVVYADDQPSHRQYVLATLADDSPETAYVPMTVAVVDADMCADVLCRLESELKAAAASLSEFEAVAATVGRDASKTRTVRAHITKAVQGVRGLAVRP